MTFLVSKTQIFNSKNNVLLAPFSRIKNMKNAKKFSCLLCCQIAGIDYSCVLLEKAHKNTIASPYVISEIKHEMIVKFCAFNGISL